MCLRTGNAMTLGFVRSLLQEGRLRVGVAPHWELSDEALDELKSSLAAQSLHLPGPPIRGSLDTLLPAIHVVYRFAWRFLNPDPSPVDQDKSLRMEHAPRSAEDHLGGDLAFRFLPGLWQRAMNRDPADDLAKTMKQLLREWPLSGVLADISEPPATPLDFGGHLGIHFLYAERLATRERPGWFPESRDGVEIVWQSLGKKLPDVPATSIANPEGTES